MEGGTMELTIIDQLLIYLVDRPRNVPMAMREAGHIQEEISAAWREARVAGYTESTRARHGSSDPSRSGTGSTSATAIGVQGSIGLGAHRLRRCSVDRSGCAGI